MGRLLSEQGRGAVMPGDAHQDLGPALAFPAAPECGFMTGQVFCVDDGQVMLRKASAGCRFCIQK